MEKHRNFTKKFNGAIVRTPEYWNKWIDSESIVLEEKKFSWIITHEQKVIGFFSVSLDSSGHGRNASEEEQKSVTPHGDDIGVRDFVTIYDDNQINTKIVEGVVGLVMAEFNMESTNVAHVRQVGVFFADTCMSVSTHHRGIMYKKVRTPSVGTGDAIDKAVDGFLKSSPTNHFWWGADAY